MLQEGIFALKTRRFGAIAEIMVKRLLGLVPALDSSHDLMDSEGKKIECKFSTVTKNAPSKINDSVDIIGEIRKALTDGNVAIDSTDKKAKWFCNIQQVKPNCFDELIYGLFFKDKIEIFKCSSKDVYKIPNYSNKQHRGNKGEGQFHIKPTNLWWHREHNSFMSVSYEELYELLSND